MNLGIIIPIYNRPQYLKRCLNALMAADIPKGTKIILVDDYSNDKEVFSIIDDAISFFKCRVQRMPQNSGIRESIKFACKNLSACDNYLVLDSDVVIKPYAITRMLDLQKQIPGHMISGINCTQFNEFGKFRNPLISVHDGYVMKEAVAGQCLLFSAKQYKDWVLPALLKDGNWDHNASINAGNGIAVTIPSVAQHIGVISAMGHNATLPDRADDFKFIKLPDVTLFGIDSHDIPGITRAANICQRDIEFGAVNIITDNLFISKKHEDRRREYSKFMLKELANHFDTSHVLTIHADGYVLNWEAWDNSWLKYDFIGASWCYKDGHNVGNGGFSLRSKKLCQILAENDIDERLMHPEDTCICRLYRDSLEKSFGIKFAPEEVANKFSIEAYGSSVIQHANRYSGQFGFHSRHVDFTGSALAKEILYPPMK